MSTMISGYITLEKLEEIAKIVKQKNEKGFKFTVSVNDTSNEYGKNVSFFAEQTKEQRDAKQKKYFFGSGNVFWTDGAPAVLGAKPAAVATAEPSNNASTDDLPF